MKPLSVVSECVVYLKRNKRKLFTFLLVMTAFTIGVIGLTKQIQHSFFAQAAGGATATGGEITQSGNTFTYSVNITPDAGSTWKGSISITAGSFSNSQDISTSQGSTFSVSTTVNIPCSNNGGSTTISVTGISTAGGGASLPQATVTYPACPTEPPTPVKIPCYTDNTKSCDICTYDQSIPSDHPNCVYKPTPTQPPDTTPINTSYDVKISAQKTYVVCPNPSTYCTNISSTTTETGDIYYSNITFSFNAGSYGGYIQVPQAEKELCDSWDNTQQTLQSSDIQHQVLGTAQDGFQPLPQGSVVKYGTGGKASCADGSNMYDSINVVPGGIAAINSVYVKSTAASVMIPLKNITTTPNPLNNNAIAAVGYIKPFTKCTYVAGRDICNTYTNFDYDDSNPKIQKRLDGQILGQKKVLHESNDVLYPFKITTGKTGTPSAYAGETVKFEIHPKLITKRSEVDQSEGVLSQPLNIIVEDTLPDWYEYVDGSASPAPKEILPNYPTEGVTTIRWQFNTITKSSQLPSTITLSAKVTNLLLDQTPVTNWTYSSFEGNKYPSAGCAGIDSTAPHPNFIKYVSGPNGTAQHVSPKGYSHCNFVSNTVPDTNKNTTNQYTIQTISNTPGLKTYIQDNNTSYNQNDVITYNLEWSAVNIPNITYALPKSQIINVLPYNGDNVTNLPLSQLGRKPATNVSGKGTLVESPISLLDTQYQYYYTYSRSEIGVFTYDQMMNSQYCTYHEFGQAGCPKDFSEVKSYVLGRAKPTVYSNGSDPTQYYYIYTPETPNERITSGSNIIDSNKYTVTKETDLAVIKNLYETNQLKFCLIKEFGQEGCPKSLEETTHRKNEYQGTIIEAMPILMTNYYNFIEYVFTSTDPNTIDRDPRGTTNLVGGTTKWCKQSEFAQPGCPTNFAAVTAFMASTNFSLKNGVPLKTQYKLNFSSAKGGENISSSFVAALPKATLDPPAISITFDNTFYSLPKPILAMNKTCSINGGTPSQDCGTAPIGSVISYTITASNAGNAPASNITITDDYREDLLETIDAITPNASTHDTTTGVLTWNSITLNAGESKTFTYTAKSKLTLEDGISIPNTAKLIDTDPATPDLQANAVVKIAKPTLAITKTCKIAEGIASSNCGSIRPGEVIKYTISITNTGSLAITNGMVSDIYSEFVEPPTGFTATPTGWEVNPTTHDTTARTLTWKNISLGANETKTITYTAKVKTTAAINSTIQNTATLTSTTSGANTPPAVQTKVTVVNAQITLTKMCSIGGATPSKDCGKARVGDRITYTITVGNKGTIDADAITITDTYPKQYIDLDVATIKPAPVRNENGVITWEKQVIPKDKTVTYTYIATVNNTVSDGQILKNIVSVTTNNPGIAPPPKVETKTTVSNPKLPILVRTGAAGITTGLLLLGLIFSIIASQQRTPKLRVNFKTTK